jgi:hypothetical protein
MSDDGAGRHGWLYVRDQAEQSVGARKNSSVKVWTADR